MSAHEVYEERGFGGRQGAVELSDDEAKKIVGEIERAAGRKVEATRDVDPSLIGGLVVQAGSVRLDASVRGRLQQLREELTT